MEPSCREDAKLDFVQITQTGESSPNSPNVSVAARTAPTADISDLKLSLLTWNIDGLNGDNISTRNEAISEEVTTLNPDFVFLQEVTANNKEIFDKLDANYDIHYFNTNYRDYTAILTSKKKFDVTSQKVIHFRDPGKGRTLQIVEGKFGELSVFLMTTLLDTMTAHFVIRESLVAQCMQAMREIIEANPNAIVIFGGDLKLMDHHVVNVPTGVADAWIANGSKDSEQFTWEAPCVASYRFDRVYFYGPLKQVDFSLKGKERIMPGRYRRSDHWAVQCIFNK